MKKILVLTGILLVAAVILTACGGQTTEAPAEPVAPAGRTGRSRDGDALAGWGTTPLAFPPEVFWEIGAG